MLNPPADREEAEAMTGLDAIQQEMSYTSYEDSCRETAIMPDGSLRECRRTRGHWNNESLTSHRMCASGFPLALWKGKP